MPEEFAPDDDRAFLGRGWSFPPTFSKEGTGTQEAGRVEMLEHEDDIVSSLHILLSTARGERIMVPASAVTERDGKQVVWLVGSDGKVEPRAVKVGAASGGDVEITAGLAAGDRIATAGLSFLRKGMQVRDLGDALGSAGGSST